MPGCRALAAVSVSLAALGGGAAAQAREAPAGWLWALDGLAVAQGDAGLDGGGTFSSRRVFLRAGGFYRFTSGNSVGLFLRQGRIAYDFGGVAIAPWGDIDDMRLSLALRLRSASSMSVLVAPSIGYDYERGAARADGRSHGVFGGVTWALSERLTIGPGFGAFTEPGGDDWDVFPALLLDWEFADGWSLSTGSGLGASRGPGLTLGHAVSDALTLGLSARHERLRFRLDGAGPAPGGVGEDRSVPIVLSARYAPHPGLSLSAFVGAELNGSLSLEDANGMRISRQDYGSAPIAGLTFRLAF
jgi:hypothetical protein